jgi:zinc transporter 1/2/3
LPLDLTLVSPLLSIENCSYSDRPVASLTTAITFHQLFEGLSLGIRIAALPPPKEVHDENGRIDCDDGASASGGTANLNQRSSNIMNRLWHSLFSSSVPNHYRSGALNRWLSKWKTWKDMHLLKPTLSFLFTVTTPAGMILGILLFGPGRRKDAGESSMLCEWT